MERFHLYAGLGGGFGGANYCETVEAENIDEACEFAYELAIEEYQSYEGCHGIMNWGDCYEDALYVQEQIKKRFGIEKFMISPVGPTIGAHSGPGTVALFFMGEAR